MAADFNLFQAPPSGASTSEPASSSGDLSMFSRPPGSGAPAVTPAPEPEPEPEPTTSSPEPAAPSSPPALDMFSRPPGRPSAETPAAPTPEPEPTPTPETPETPETPSGPDLFSRPPGAPSEPSQAPSAEAPPSSPTPTPAPSERFQRPRRPRREQEGFENEELWQQFLDEKHEGGRGLVEHPDVEQRRRRRSRSEPRIRFNTAMNYENYRDTIGREYEAWKREQQEGPSGEVPPLSVSGVVRDVRSLQVGDVLQTSLQNSLYSQTIRITELSAGPGSAVRYNWKKDDGSWSTRAKAQFPRTMVNNRYRLAERPGSEEDSGNRVEVGAQIEDTDTLRAGDFIENSVLSSHGTVRKILKVLPNGDLKTQRVSARNGIPVGNPERVPRAQIRRQKQFSNYSHYKRVSDPAEDRAQQEQRDRQQREKRENRNRQQREEREEQQRQQREREEAAQQEDQPHVGVGDPILHPRSLRVGDIFANGYLLDMGKYRKVVEVRSNGDVVTQLYDRGGTPQETPDVFRKAVIEQHGPYKRFLGPGHVISSPSDVGPGTYIKKGDKDYRVVRRTPTLIYLQDVYQGRGVGRPTKIKRSDLEGGEYKIQVTPHSAETGSRITTPGHMRQGQVLRAMHHRTPKWVRVVSTDSDGVKLQPINGQTGEENGEIEELSKEDLKRWAYVTKVGNLPEALLPPLEVPSGGFAEAGSGELTPNTQSGRYDDVHFSLTGATDDDLRDMLELDPGVNPRHVVADLAGAGGMAKSLSSISISVSSGDISVSGTGDHIRNLSRTIEFRGGKADSIYNSHFRLGNDAPKGMGLKMFATQVAAARDHGISRIGVNAAGSGPWLDGQYNGYYVWPRFGYDGEFSSYMFDRMPSSVQDSIREVNPSAPHGLRFLDVMMAGSEARDWWKDHGDAENLKFDLSEGSRSLEYLTSYVQEVAERDGNIGADQYLQRAARFLREAQLVLGAKKKKKSEEHEEYPTFGPEEEKISDRIWDRMGEEARKKAKSKKKTKSKKTAFQLMSLAKGNPELRTQLLRELAKEKA